MGHRHYGWFWDSARWRTSGFARDGASPGRRCAESGGETGVESTEKIVGQPARLRQDASQGEWVETMMPRRLHETPSKCSPRT